MNGLVDFSKYQKQVAHVLDQYTRVSNSIVDDEIMAQLSDKAFKCYMLITRYTAGYNKGSAQIATTVFQKYCGIKRSETVHTCIRELEQLKLVHIERKTGITNTFSLLKVEQLNEEIDRNLDKNQYGQTVVPENRTSTVEQEGTSTVEQDGTSTVEPHPNKEKLKEKLKENICDVFEFWKTTFRKKSDTLLSDKRKSKIQARLRQGYTVDQIKQAITNCSNSEYHIQNGHTDIELICREPEKLDRFIAMSVKAPAVELAHPTPEQQPVFKGVAKKYKGVNV